MTLSREPVDFGVFAIGQTPEVPDDYNFADESSDFEMDGLADDENYQEVEKGIMESEKDIDDNFEDLEIE